MKKISILFSAVVFVMAVTSQWVLAAEPWGNWAVSDPFNPAGPNDMWCMRPDSAGNPKQIASLFCLLPLFQNILTVVFVFLGVVLFMRLAMAVWTYLSSAGDENKLKESKSMATNTIIGLTAILLSFLFFKTLQFILGGVDVTNFRITP